MRGEGAGQPIWRVDEAQVTGSWAPVVRVADAVSVSRFPQPVRSAAAIASTAKLETDPRRDGIISRMAVIGFPRGCSGRAGHRSHLASSFLSNSCYHLCGGVENRRRGRAGTGRPRHGSNESGGPDAVTSDQIVPASRRRSSDGPFERTVPDPRRTSGFHPAPWSCCS